MSTVKILAILVGNTRLMKPITRAINVYQITPFRAIATAMCGSMGAL